MLSGIQFIFQRAVTLFDEFFDPTGRLFSRLNYGSLALRPVALLALLVGADRTLIQPTRTFTSGLPMVWSPIPSPDITTAPTGKLALAGLSPARSSTSLTALSGPICSGASACNLADLVRAGAVRRPPGKRPALGTAWRRRPTDAPASLIAPASEPHPGAALAHESALIR